jgi:hypothetical protein
MYYKLAIHRLYDTWPKNKWWEHPEIFTSRKVIGPICESWNNNIWKAKVISYKKQPKGILKSTTKKRKS